MNKRKQYQIELDKWYAQRYLTSVAASHIEVYPIGLEDSIKRSGCNVGYVIEFHVERGMQFELLKLIWNGCVLQTYRKPIGHNASNTNFEACIQMVQRIHASNQYQNIEWDKLPY